MYCAKCGFKLDEGNFCPQCGARQITAQSGDNTLPEGVIRDENGVISWIWPERDYSVLFFMDTDRAGMKVVRKEKKETVGSAFKELVKSGVELVADNIVTDSDAYAGLDLPWDTAGGGNSTYLTFKYLKKIKRNPKKNEIQLKENISSMTLYMTAQQYPFISDYVIRHAPDAKIK